MGNKTKYKVGDVVEIVEAYSWYERIGLSTGTVVKVEDISEDGRLGVRDMLGDLNHVPPYRVKHSGKD